MIRKAISGIMLTLMLTGVTLAFNSPKAMASGTIYIRADGSVDPPTAPISTVDNATYTLTGDISSNVDGIVVERSNIIIDGNGYTLQGTGEYWSIGIGLTDRANVTIQNTKITDFYFGIGLWRSSNTSITGNDVTANAFAGIYLATSYDGSIRGNNITANDWSGIFLDYSHYNRISGNNITANDGDGFILSWYSSHNRISGNNITANDGDGIHTYDSRSNSFSGNNITANKNYGMYLGGSYYDKITANNIENNGCGIGLGWGRYSPTGFDAFYHNNFIANAQQVNIEAPADMHGPHAWDDGYPSGGNHWSDHVTVDDFSGVNQDELGSDGIVDEPYVIDGYNRDNYPLAQPWSVIIPATLDIAPDALNLKSQGPWITAYVELPEAYDVNDIDVSSIMLNDTVPAKPEPIAIGDFDNDEIPDLMVKFDVESFIFDHINLREAVRVGFTTVTLTITGELTNGTPFQGSDTIKIVCTPPHKL